MGQLEGHWDFPVLPSPFPACCGLKSVTFMDALSFHISWGPWDLSTPWPQTPAKQTLIEKVLNYLSVLSIDDSVTKLSQEEAIRIFSQKL